jgi:hypothetical protein
MARHRALLLALLPLASLLACSGGGPGAQTADDDLIGGRLAKKGEFPATMQVKRNCTVSKVGPRHVLTAAHCVNWMFSPGAEIELSASQVIGTFAKGRDDGFRTFTIERVEIEPAWDSYCRATHCGSVHISGRTAMADAAVIILTEEIPEVPEAAIDLSPIEDGDQVAITGYGCEDAVAGSWDYSGSRLRVSHTYAVGFEQTIHKGSFISERDREGGVVESMRGIYAITPGPAYVAPKITASETADDELAAADGGAAEDAGKPASGPGSRGPRRGGLCPGDSGGPLYRIVEGEAHVVGINANYTFSGGREHDVGELKFNYGGRPTTNWHTRVDGTYGLKVGRWLADLGVNTVCTRGRCE